MKALALLFSAILSTIFTGYALSTVWGWFIVDKFNLPTLNIVEALGVLLVVKFMTLQLNITDMDAEDREVKVVMFQWLLPAMMLLVGWIYTLFM